VDAQLVFHADGSEAVACAQAAVLVHQIFGRKKQRDAARSGRRVGQARQHEMDNVVRHVVVAPGDEDLLAAEAVGAVAARHRRGAQGPEVRARLRLGQHHGTGPFARHQSGQIAFLLFRCSMGLQRLDGRLGEHGAQAKCHVRGMESLEGGQFQCLGQGLTAPAGGGGKAEPAAFGELAIGIGKARRGAHGSVGAGRALTIPDRVQRCQHLAGELSRRIQNRLGQIGVVVGIGARLHQSRQVRDRLKAKAQLPHGRAIGHGLGS
jgi:hypothetical protein